MGQRADVYLVPWSDGDGWLLERLLGDAAMMSHLGGPETSEKIAERLTRYVSDPRRVCKIAERSHPEGVGWVGYWERVWRDEDVYEMGWSVLPEHQGQGVASAAATQAIARARAERARRYVHAFPSVDNGPSNAICRELGMVDLGTCRFEYPPGRWMRCFDWRFDLSHLARVARAQ